MKKLLIILFSVIAFCGHSQISKSVTDLNTQNDVIRNETVPWANTRARIADMNKSIYVSSPNLFGTYAYPQSWLTGYQPTLVSGTSLKTINSNSLLGSGDIVIGGLSGLTINKILYATSSSTAGNGPDWDATNNALTINSARIFQLNNSIKDLFIGEAAGNFTAIGGGNIGIGKQVLSGNTSGTKNIAIGYTAGATISTGNFNIKIGQVGAITTGSSNVEIGDASQVPSATSDGQLSIQNIIYGTGNTNQGTTVSTGNIGIGIQAPTARLHIPAGTATAGTAPLKIPSGTNLTTTEAGALENNGTHVYFSFANGGSRFQLDNNFSNTAAANELIMSNGTNGVPSALFKGSSLGDLQLGSAAISGDRIISTAASVSASKLILNAQGGSSSSVQINNNILRIGSGLTHSSSQIFAESVSANASLILGAKGSSSVGFLNDTNGTLGTFQGNGLSVPFGVFGVNSNTSAASGIVGEEINSTVSTYTSYTTTATYQNVTSITLTAGDWDISGFLTYSSNSATITAASNAIFVISTTTASAAGATEGQNISYIPQAALLGTSKFSETIAPYRVSFSGTTTYYLNTQATFTLGNPQFVGSIRARRIR